MPNSTIGADALRAALTEAQAGLEFAAARLPAQEGDFVPAHLAALEIVNAALASAAQPTPAGYVLPPGEHDERMERAIAMVRSFGLTISEARTALARAGRLAAAQPEAPGRWLVVNVGCIECGVSTALVGRFHSEELAEAVANECSIAHAWREGGQNDFQVFDLEAPCSAEYAEAIARAAKAGGTP